jgi:hypothetical protein
MSPVIDQILAERFKAGVEQLGLRPINVLIVFKITRNCLKNGRS